MNFVVDSDDNDDEFVTNPEDPKPDLQERENQLVRNGAVVSMWCFVHCFTLESSSHFLLPVP